MKKENIGKNLIHPNMNRKKIVVDKHMNSLKKDLIRDLDGLSHSYNQMSSLLNKASYKRMFVDDYNPIALQCSKKCSSMSQNGELLKNQFDTKYNDDVKMSLIDSLNERITYLESKLLSK